MATGVVYDGTKDEDPPPVPGTTPAGGTQTPSKSVASSSSKSNYKKNEAYIQMYRLIFGKNVKPNMKLINLAVKNRWSSAYFKMQVRLQDKNYFKSQEAKSRTADFAQYWKAIFPDKAMSKTMLKDYLKNSWTSQQLENKVTGTKLFKREYKYYGAFGRAQREAGKAKNVDPLAYKQYQDTFRDAYKQAGQALPTGFERAYFRSGITGDEFRQNFLLSNQSAAAAQWDLGGLTQQQQKSAMFSGRGSAQIQTKLQQALAKQQQYFKQGAGLFRTQTEGDTLTLKGL